MEGKENKKKDKKKETGTRLGVEASQAEEEKLKKLETKPEKSKRKKMVCRLIVALITPEAHIVVPLVVWIQIAAGHLRRHVVLPLVRRRREL